MIPGVPQVGGPELLMLSVVILLLFGSSRFSNMAREVGQLIGGTKRTLNDAKSDLVSEELDEIRHAVDDLEGKDAQREQRRREP